MATETSDRILDFGATGMWWEITRSTADTAGEYFEAVNVINPEFDGPPLHTHPNAEETYQVIEGVLDVYVDGAWRSLKAGESARRRRNSPHVEKLQRRRSPAGQQAHACHGIRAVLPADACDDRRGTSGLRRVGRCALVPISMLFVVHQREIVSVKPPRAVMRAGGDRPVARVQAAAVITTRRAHWNDAASTSRSRALNLTLKVRLRAGAD